MKTALFKTTQNLNFKSALLKTVFLPKIKGAGTDLKMLVQAPDEISQLRLFNTGLGEGLSYAVGCWLGVDEKGLATTIVITTHYTEEAMQAHRVGKSSVHYQQIFMSPATPSADFHEPCHTISSFHEL